MGDTALRALAYIACGTEGFAHLKAAISQQAPVARKRGSAGHRGGDGDASPRPGVRPRRMAGVEAPKSRNL